MMSKSGRMFIVWTVIGIVTGFLTLTKGQVVGTTTGNCSVDPTVCYLNTPYPVALRPGLNCTVLFPALVDG